MATTEFISAPRVKALRHRRRFGLNRRTIDVPDKVLDGLIAARYLDADRRGDAADEAEAIEMFLADSLPKPR
jgi:hypothetical protein